MKPNYSFVQYKIKIGILLTVLIAAIVANNLWFSRNIKHMDHAATSIYNDRLMAATYISDLTHLLYAQKLHMVQGNGVDNNGRDVQLSRLVTAYDSTILTSQERVYWNSFKHQLHISNNQVSASLQINDLDQALQSLQQLTKIQASEGNTLMQNIREDVSSTSIGLFLEIAIAIIIGLLVLTLLGISKNAIVATNREAALN